MFTKSNTPFYGIVPGNAAIPLGSVVLPVTFGESRDNYRTEYVKFEVADFETSYHAILGMYLTWVMSTRTSMVMAWTSLILILNFGVSSIIST
jgi:hypothetical protein